MSFNIEEITSKDFSVSAIPEDVLLWLCFDELQLKDLPKIRRTIQNSLKGQINSCQETMQSFLLSATEILANLVKHPVQAPSYIGVSIYTEVCGEYKMLVLNVSDNSESMLEFDEKCNASSSRVNETVLDDGNGRGLGIITTLMDNIRYETSLDSTDNLNHMIISKVLKFKPKAQPINKKSTVENSYLKKHTIFIVDDDPILRQLLKNILSDHYNTCVFSSGAEVLDAFDKTVPDLILSDLLMPVMDGAELRDALSEKEQGDITPFVFLSGHPEEAGKDYINRLGIDGFLNKSIKKEDLLLTLERIIRRSKQVNNNIRGHIDKSIIAALSPSIPEKIKDWSFALEYDIAETGGGDFVLHYETDEGIIVVLADVMGHGLPAKFFSYAYVGYLRSLIRLHFNDHLRPSSLLQILSKNVYEDSFLESCIFTCQVVHLAPDGTINISSAGHPWPIIAKNNNETNFLEISGPLPGMIPAMHYSNMTYKMEAGESLFLYTDGIIENIDKADDEKGKNILKQSINGCSSSSDIKEKTKCLWSNQVKNFEDNVQDDSTILAMQYTPRAPQ